MTWVVGRVPELGLDWLTERVPADERERALAHVLAGVRVSTSAFANFLE